MVEIAQLEETFLKENHNLGLAYAEGYIFFKVIAEELVTVLYDPSIEDATTNSLINIANRSNVSKQQLNSSLFTVSNMFDATMDFHIYQLFFGVQPSMARVFMAISNIEQRELDIGNWGRNAVYRFGYISGFTSPFSRPSPKSEVFIPQGSSLYVGVFNPLPYTISPTFYFVINRMKTIVHKDVDTVEAMVRGRLPVRLASIGGLAPPSYNMHEKWKVKPIKLDATKEQIASALGGS